MSGGPLSGQLRYVLNARHSGRDCRNPRLQGCRRYKPKEGRDRARREHAIDDPTEGGGRARREHAIDDPTEGGGRARREHAIDAPREGEGRARREHAIDAPREGEGRARREHAIESTAGAVTERPWMAYRRDLGGFGKTCMIFFSRVLHPCKLDSGNPCRNDGFLFIARLPCGAAFKALEIRTAI
jgi:hypothetical protein